MFKLWKILITTFTISALLISSSIPVFAANDNTVPSEEQQALIYKIMSDSEHNEKVKDALSKIVAPKLKPDETATQTITVDNFKYVIDWKSEAIKNNIKSDASVIMSSGSRVASCTIHLYNNSDMWMYTLSYKTPYSYNGTTVSCGTPYWTFSKASWLVSAKCYQSNLVYNNYGDTSSSSGLAHVVILATPWGEFLNYYYTGDATMWANGNYVAGITP